MLTGERRKLEYLKGTGFNPLDPDYTQGRGMAMDAANRQARMDIGMTRRVWINDEKDASHE